MNVHAAGDLRTTGLTHPNGAPLRLNTQDFVAIDRDRNAKFEATYRPQALYNRANEGFHANNETFLLHEVAINLPIFPDNGADLVMTISTNFVGTTQYGSPTSEKESTQNGYSSGSLQRFSTDASGTIIGQYSNGKSRPLAQFVLANFASPDGLIPLGNNVWAESSASGAPQVGAPGQGNLGQLRSSSVESSNVDLTKELVDMITAQRVYQANAQTIKTQDSVLQTLVNLR